MQNQSGAPDPQNTIKCELAGEVLRSFGQLRFAATGWSMLPSVRPGETLVVERVDPDLVRVGNVVLVARGEKLCAHRVVNLMRGPEGPQWITQGDALPAPDQPVSAHELLGRVTYLIRDGKLTSVPESLDGVNKLIARIVRHSSSAARAFVYLNRSRAVPQKSVLPCQL